MNFDLLDTLHLIMSLAGLVFMLATSDVKKIRTAALLTLSLMFALEFFAPVLGLVDMAESTVQRIGVFIVLGNLLASFYTPAFMSSRMTFGLILLMNFLTLSMIKVADDLALLVIPPAFFAILIVACGRKNGMYRILTFYGVICSSLIGLSLLIPASDNVNRLLLELAGLVFLIGLFPVSPWFSRLYETLPSGLLASGFVLQVVFVMSLEQQQSLARDALLLVLPVLALLSVLMAIAQPCARRALSGLASSQLAFLVYADSGQHFSDLAAILLAQAQMITIPGLILTVGTLEMKVGKLNLSRPSGQYDSYPKLASAMLLFGLMGAGFPLSLAYVAEDLVLETGFHETPMQGIAWLFVAAVTTISVIKMYLYLCHGGRGREPGMDILPSKLFASVFATLFLVYSSVTLPG